MGVKIPCERIALKEIEPSDIDFLYRLDILGEMVRFERNEPESREDICKKYQWYMDKSSEVPESGGLCFVIVLPDGTLIGRVQIHCNWELVREWEIGYALLPEYWGKGYASEAALALAKYAFEHMNVHKIMAMCNADNARSAALMERIGMVREGRLREDRWIQSRWYDSYVYSLLKRDLFPAGEG